jgi:RNA polymerase sigma factor (TIGR02999 family)
LALEALTPLVYDDLRRLAAHHLRSERGSHTLQATALVHEVFLRLVGTDVPWQDRAHFLGVAARAMRRILVDHARGQARLKRGKGLRRVSLEETVVVSPGPRPEILALDEALERLAVLDERKARAVELVYFGGLTQREVGEALGASLATVERELRQARAWLSRELSACGA